MAPTGANGSVPFPTPLRPAHPGLHPLSSPSMLLPRQWPEGSDIVARFCTLRESKNLRPCENRVRNVQKSVTQFICLGPGPRATAYCCLQAPPLSHCLAMFREQQSISFHAAFFPRPLGPPPCLSCCPCCAGCE